MNRIKTYTAFPDADSVVHPVELDQIQNAMAPVAPLIGFRQGGDLRNDGAGGSVVKVSPNRIVMSAFGKDYAVVTAESTQAASTSVGHHYLYAGASGTSETLATSTTAPDGALVYKTGDAASRYLGAYVADATGILPVYKTGCSYLFRRSLIASTRLLAATLTGTTIAVASNGVALPTGTINVASTAAFASAGTIYVVTGSGLQTVAYTGKTGTSFTGCTGGVGNMATGGAVSPYWAAVSLAAWVPPHARAVHVLLDLVNTDPAPSIMTAGLRTTGDTTFESGRAVAPFYSAVAVLPGKQQLALTLECDASQQVDMDMTGVGTAKLYVLGFDEHSV